MGQLGCFCALVSRIRAPGPSAHVRTTARLPDLADIACRRRAELPEILAAELRSAFIADRERHVGRAVLAGKQQLTGFL